MLVEVVADLLGGAEHVEELWELVVLQSASQLRLRKIAYNLKIGNIDININNSLLSSKVRVNSDWEKLQATLHFKNINNNINIIVCINIILLSSNVFSTIGSPTLDKYSPRDVCGWQLPSACLVVYLCIFNLDS